MAGAAVRRPLMNGRTEGLALPVNLEPNPGAAPPTTCVHSGFCVQPPRKYERGRSLVLMQLEVHTRPGTAALVAQCSPHTTKVQAPLRRQEPPGACGLARQQQLFLHHQRLFP